MSSPGRSGYRLDPGFTGRSSRSAQSATLRHEPTAQPGVLIAVIVFVVIAAAMRFFGGAAVQRAARDARTAEAGSKVKVRGRSQGRGRQWSSPVSRATSGMRSGMIAQDAGAVARSSSGRSRSALASTPRCSRGSSRGCSRRSPACRAAASFYLIETRGETGSYPGAVVAGIPRSDRAAAGVPATSSRFGWRRSTSARRTGPSARTACSSRATTSRRSALRAAAGRLIGREDTAQPGATRGRRRVASVLAVAARRRRADVVGS